MNELENKYNLKTFIYGSELIIQKYKKTNLDIL